MKRLLALVLCFSLAAGMVPLEVLAADTAESERLFTNYVQGLFYESEEVSAAGEQARAQLGKPARGFYDYLKAGIAKVAAGEQSETVFRITHGQILEWGGSECYPVSNIDAAMEAFIQEFEVDAVLEALLHDCAYELYWYDKVSGCHYWFVMSSDQDGYHIDWADFAFQVVRDHQASGYTEDVPKMKTKRAAAAVAAAKNARALVAEYAGKGDYGKLNAYKKEICSLVSYNNTAAHSGNFSRDADPWQLVYVFDGDSSTNVVCEGYAKAFQYLCDASAFRGDVKCYTVSGWAYSEDGGEGHMWNLVSIGGKRYLADITNSDAGTLGVEGKLFLAGASGSIANGYDAGPMTYCYDQCTKDLWGTGSGSILKLTSADYDPNKIRAPKITAANKAANGKPRLTWEKVSGAVKYQIYRSTSKNGTYTRMYTTTGTSYTNTSAKVGKLYYYKVRAVNANGTTSAFSNIVSRTCDLAQPEISISRSAAGKPRISWEKVDGAVKYQIYRSTTGKSGSFKRIYTTAKTTFTNTGAKAGTRYYYKVRAVHSNGNANSAFSAVKYIRAK